MIRLRFLLIFLGLIGSLSFGFAQKGVIRGSVFDDATGEALIGVSVQIKGTSTGNVTDFDGKFTIAVDPGTYDLQVSYISFQTMVISGVKVTSGEVTLIDNIRLKEDVQTLEAVVVTAETIRDSEAALLTVKKKAANLMDGISAVKFRQIGDSDASEAVKRVTGVSVEGGKYVFVRGLGDRYTKTTLNTVDIPGLDPDRNSIQIDIFPTNLINNIVVLKSSVAEMPADFTGGVVNIETKDFPDQKVFNVSFGLSFNPSMHFRNDYFMYDGGKTDWLGFDDGGRKLPAGAFNTPFPSVGTGASDQEISGFLKGFNKNLSAQNKSSFMDFNLGFSAANQKNFKNGHSLGYIFSTTYKSSTIFYDDAVYGEYQRPAASDEYELIYATVQTGEVAERNILLGTLGGLAYKTHQSKYKLAVLHLQNGESKAARFFIDDNGSATGKSGFTASTDNLEYSQRGVTNILLNGEHYNKDKTFSIDWRLSPTLSKIEEPDIRKTAFTYTSSDTVFSPGAAGYPTRIWRNLEEVNAVAKVDFKKEHSWLGKGSVLKFGLSYVFKERDYEILKYNLQFFGTQPEYNGNPEVVLDDEYLYPNGSVYFASGNTTPNSNAYNSTVSNAAAYVSNQFQFSDRFKAIVGVRAEKYIQRHTGRDIAYASGNTEDGKNLDNAKVLDELNLFPSANIVYALTDDQNVRVSYSRTVARPSFKELSFAQILDPVSNRIFNGALFTYPDWDGNLKQTLIDNFDVRWEMFQQRGQLLSISAFYKKFDDPIELIRIPTALTNNEFQPRNVGDGTAIGAEFEFKKSFGFLTSLLNNLFVSGNITVVKSALDMSDTEFNARKEFEKDGQTLERTREMSGQAPYVVNLGLSYEDAELGFDGGFFYNVNGPTLTVVGGGLFPDVYSEPFHSLNFNMNKGIGKEKKVTLTLSVSNILNDAREHFFTGYEADKQYYTKFNPGTSFGFGFKYSL
ncbi:MAG: TonB-dependent receptor [Bacteroidia bacterium]|nr:TonB-dependent receptor [Bacteroidia bacterium]